MIQEMERSWRIASSWVSPSTVALKNSVTYFFGDDIRPPSSRVGRD